MRFAESGSKSGQCTTRTNMYCKTTKPKLKKAAISMQSPFHYTNTSSPTRTKYYKYYKDMYYLTYIRPSHQQG